MRVFPLSSHLSLVGTNVVVLLASILMQDLPGDKPGDAPAILQIRVLEGEGVAYPLGGRATRGVTVQVTDETGKPIDAASVSFRLPEEGPSGSFSNGSRNEITTTKADGKASAWGMQWNRTEGSFEIRITAAKGSARAGTVCAVYLSKSTVESEASSPVRLAKSHKWLWIALAAAGAAGAVVAAAALRGKATPAGPAATPTTIGTPTIVIGGS
jgi:hypothetical protein